MNREKILEGTIKVFQKKGLKFTMDDLASELSMSKKTIYQEFRDKESLFYVMVDYCFDKIKISEQAVMDDPNLDTVQKFRRILNVMPESYQDIDFRQLYPLKEKYPKVYQQIEKRLETGWENTLSLLKEGISQGRIRDVNPLIFKAMMEASLERFFQSDFLIANGISYQEGLDEVVDLLLNGVLINKGE